MYVVCIPHDSEYAVERLELAELLGLEDVLEDRWGDVYIPTKKLAPMGADAGRAYLFQEHSLARAVADTYRGVVFELEPYPWG